MNDDGMIYFERSLFRQTIKMRHAISCLSSRTPYIQLLAN